MQPADWAELPDSELVRLLGQAIAAPSRVGARKGAGERESGGEGEHSRTARRRDNDPP
jgi:hypothetical protein